MLNIFNGIYKEGFVLLKTKAKSNCEVAKWAENNNYYDVAVSRYYYYIFQHLIFYIEAKNINLNDSRFKKRTYHIKIIGAFIKYIKDTNNYETNSEIGQLYDLRDERNKSDYEKRILNDEMYKKYFLRKYNLVLKALRRLNVIGVNSGTNNC